MKHTAKKVTEGHPKLPTGTKILKDMLRKLRTKNKKYSKDFKDTRISANRKLKKQERKHKPQIETRTGNSTKTKQSEKNPRKHHDETTTKQSKKAPD